MPVTETYLEWGYYQVMSKTKVSKWRIVGELLVLMVVICPATIASVIYLLGVVGFWGSQIDSPYPEGWQEANFQGTVVSLEGRRPTSKSRPGYAVVDIGDGKTYRMPRRVGMAEAPFVGEEVRKKSGETTFDSRDPAHTDSKWNTWEVLDGPEGAGTILIILLEMALIALLTYVIAFVLYFIKRFKSSR